jgi:hypothetical protein
MVSGKVKEFLWGIMMWTVPGTEFWRGAVKNRAGGREGLSGALAVMNVFCGR